ncbi:DegT/DnrJ/EryC1/StrS family aminotransferase [Gemmatimonadota bacterium]
MHIPLVDLRIQYENLHSEIDRAMQDVISNSAFIGGPPVSQFEESFAAYLGTTHAVGVGNGTDALYLALKAAGIGPGDEVLLPAMTFIATSEAVSLTGAHPVFADIRNDDYCIDLEDAESKITPSTKAIIPVHLYGQPADMSAVMALAKQYGLTVIEDTAQAHAAKFGDQTAGTIGDLGCFSFYPGKNLGAYGDGGAVVTGDAELAMKVRRLANHGRSAKYDHSMEGVNSRLDGLQAAVLSVKLRYLDAWSAARYDNALEYSKRLTGMSEVTTPRVLKGRTHVFHLYALRVQRRDELLAHLREHGVGAGIHYPIPCPLLEAYSDKGYRSEDFPVASQVAGELLSLPMFPELTIDQIEYIVAQVGEFYGYPA